MEMHHIARDQFETRALILAMSIREIGGKIQMVAAHICGPIGLIDLDDTIGGAVPDRQQLISLCYSRG